MLMWCGDTGPLSKCMPVMAGHVFAHGGRSANQGEPASKMALTYQIHLKYSAFSEITYYNSNKILTYSPGNIFTDQIGPFIDIHLGKQFYFGSKPNKGYPSRSDIYNLLSILLKNRKDDEASSMDFKIVSPNYGNQR